MLIIIPAYNEEANVGRIVSRCRRYGQVVVIDDGSVDRTAEVAAEADAYVISHKRNKGYGEALQTGYRFALEKGYEVAVQLDADGQHLPRYIPDFVREIYAGADVVLGSRFIDVPGYKIPFFRRLGMLIFSYLASRICGHRFTDTTTGYRAFNRKALEFCTGPKYPRDYPDANALVLMHKTGLRIREIPVRMRANTKGTSMHGGAEPLYYICRMLYSLGRGLA